MKLQVVIQTPAGNNMLKNINKCSFNLSENT